MAKLRTTLGTAAEEYHIESANLGAYNLPVNNQVNYDEEVFELVKSSALKLDSKRTIGLPLDSAPISMSLEEAIKQRRSSRSFSKNAEAIGIEQLSKLLHLANGMRPREEGNERPFNDCNAASAGGLASVEVFCFVMNVSKLEPGIYHFDARKHELELQEAGDFSKWLGEYAFMQSDVAQAAAVLVLTSKIGLLERKYGARAYRLGLLDAGHVSSHVYLTATALELNVCAYSGFIDAQINRALKLDGLEHCALLCLGLARR